MNIKLNDLPLVVIGETFANSRGFCRDSLGTLYFDNGYSIYPATNNIDLVLTLSKLDIFSPMFVKTSAITLSIKAGTVLTIFNKIIKFEINTSVIMPTLNAGTDYAIYICLDGTLRADANFTNPVGYTTINSKQIGGFHYGLVPANATVANGSFATSGNGMIWTQADVDKIAGINSYSIWDLKFRPKCSNPRGMAFVNNLWVDIYFCSTDTDVNGTSKAGTNIASGTVPPKIPVAFGGNGTLTYPDMKWWVANELARANQKRLMLESEFVDAAFGVTENQSIDATASTYPVTQRNAGYTSKYGIEQATGHAYTWGHDSNFNSEAALPAFSWKNTNGNRGQIYVAGTYGLSRVLLGGARTNGVLSGSRASSWHSYPWYSYWNISLRAVCDHLQLI